MPEDTFYFSHDFNTRTNPKIKKLLAKHKMSGYGIFWALIEDLYNNANALPTDYDSISYDMRITKETLTSIICDFDLFRINDGVFSSDSVAKRMAKRLSKSEKARLSAEQRWNKNANALPTQSDSNAIKERKGKERKENTIPIFPLNISFEKFWNAYDKKISPDKCKKKWEVLSDTEREKIIAHVEKYKESQPDKQFRKNPESYLNQKAWNDEVIQAHGNVVLMTKDIKNSSFI